MVYPLVLVGFTVVFVTLAGRMVYNVFFHGLAKYPGPLLWRSSRLPMLACMMSGSLPQKLKELHDEYGDIVRVAPDELSYTDPAAWHDIYHRRDFARPNQWKPTTPGNAAESLVTANEPDHHRIRNVFAPAFSEKAVRAYEPVVQRHADAMLARFEQHATATTTPKEKNNAEPKTIDLVEWFNFCLFDITMDLGWASSFEMVESGNYHPWVVNVRMYKQLLTMVCLKYLQPLGYIAEKLMPQSAKLALVLILQVARENVVRRLGMDGRRDDIFNHSLLGDNKDPERVNMSMGELEQASMILITAGSEPASTVLSGIMTQLLRHPHVLQTLQREIRISFKSASDINDLDTRSLTYLNAVINEGLRLCPPFPDSLRRQVPTPGTQIVRDHLPAGTVVAVSPWAMYRCKKNFQHSQDFVVERWLTKPYVKGGQCSDDFPDDRRAAFQPYSYGPRNCLGRNLAMMELRLILTKLLYKYDLTPALGSGVSPWESLSVYWTVEKQPLLVKVQRAC